MCAVALRFSGRIQAIVARARAYHNHSSDFSRCFAGRQRPPCASAHQLLQRSSCSCAAAAPRAGARLVSKHAREYNTGCSVVCEHVWWQALPLCERVEGLCREISHLCVPSQVVNGAPSTQPAVKAGTWTLVASLGSPRGTAGL